MHGNHICLSYRRQSISHRLRARFAARNHLRDFFQIEFLNQRLKSRRLIGGQDDNDVLNFAGALKLLGRRKVIDLVALMGNYAGTAALLTAFDMQLDPGQKPLLPVDDA